MLPYLQVLKTSKAINPPPPPKSVCSQSVSLVYSYLPTRHPTGQNWPQPSQAYVPTLPASRTRRPFGQILSITTQPGFSCPRLR